MRIRPHKSPLVLQLLLGAQLPRDSSSLGSSTILCAYLLKHSSGSLAGIQLVDEEAPKTALRARPGAELPTGLPAARERSAEPPSSQQGALLPLGNPAQSRGSGSCHPPLKTAFPSSSRNSKLMHILLCRKGSFLKHIFINIPI